jgi:predicted protein tyrosine phosphatase
MKINVVSKKFLKTQWYKDKNWFFDPHKIFITIAGLADGCEYPCPYLAEAEKNPSKILRLLFDDITESEADNPALRIFTQDYAKKIKEFIDSFKNSYKWFDGMLYVNCAAGISRSGAVGYCLNEYINNNKENYFYYNLFKEQNSHIQPNPMVKRILSNELFGNIDYSEIFKNG